MSSACISIRQRTQLVLCVDEKSQIQALDRTQPLLRCGRGSGAPHPRLRPPRHRHAVRGFDIASGTVTGRPTHGTAIRSSSSS